jgi:hypothetical protein
MPAPPSIASITGHCKQYGPTAFATHQMPVSLQTYPQVFCVRHIIVLSAAPLQVEGYERTRWEVHHTHTANGRWVPEEAVNRLPMSTSLASAFA